MVGGAAGASKEVMSSSKPYMIRFQMDLVPLQYHVVKASKSLEQVVTVSAGNNITFYHASNR